VICVDASIAVKWVIEEPDSPLATGLSAAAFRHGVRLVAPRIMHFEVTNTLRRRCVREGMPVDDARERLGRCLAVPVDLLHWDTIHDAALVLADTFNLPAAYDAHYLALAERERCDFWTADRRLLNAVGGRLPYVRDLAAFDESSF
jgi:predicted nucleic acid-binding protein